jgi:hypothetical protein
MVEELQKKRDYWRTTDWPTMEFTTSISPKGCIVNCAFCPQRTLEKIYHAHEGQPKNLSLENFKKICDKLPHQVRVTFSGFTEPWLNRDCSKMVKYAYYKGHPLSAFSTGVGMHVEDVELIKSIPWTTGPNGGFCLHVPDKERIAEHPITDRLIKVFEKNLVGEATIKPTLQKLMNRVQSAPKKGPSTCGCIEHLYHNVVLPNGEVSLCCMDYSLEKILGNILYEEYDDIMPSPLTTFDMCSRCENGVSPSDIIKDKNIKI